MNNEKQVSPSEAARRGKSKGDKTCVRAIYLYRYYGMQLSFFQRIRGDGYLLTRWCASTREI